MEDLEIQLTFDSTESVVMQIGGNAFIFYLNIKNNFPEQIKVELPFATYLTSHGEEVEQNVWLSGLIDGRLGATIRSGAYKKAGIVIYQSILKNTSKGDRLFVKLNVAELSVHRSYEFICTDPSQNSFSLLTERKAETIAKLNPGKQEITSLIERLELLEEKFGIAISGLYASHNDLSNGTRSCHHVTINFDVSSLSGGKLSQGLKINASVYNAAGQLLGITPAYIHSDRFLGFDSMSILATLEQEPAKIRLSPSGW